MIVKLSWSSMSAWSQGRQEDAVNMYLGKGIPETPAMKLGKVLHQKWEKYIAQNNEIPEELGGGQLVDPLVEKFMGVTLPLNDDYQIHVIAKIDLIDGSVVWDWKSGLGNPGQYMNGRASQTGLYQVAAKGNGIKLIEGRFVCYNPYLKTHSVGVQFLDDQTERDALEFIYTIGSEMINYLETQKLLKDYDVDWMNKSPSAKQLAFYKRLGGKRTDLTAGEIRNEIDSLLEKEKAK